MAAVSRPSPDDDARLTRLLAGAAFLSAALLAINSLGPRFTGISYFPREFTPLLALALQFSWFARKIRAEHPRLAYLVSEPCHYALAMIAGAALVTGIQYTPFAPIDGALLACDRAVGFRTEALIAWTAAHPFLRRGLMFAYDSTDLQLVLVPLIPLLSRDARRLRVYILAIVYAYLLGGLFYYFFPSSGPATVIPSPHFLDVQQLTHVKFAMVHARRPVTTIMGGMIAFPSFHVAWSALLPYAAAGRRKWFQAIAALNILVVLSTLLLGWHYLVDVPAGLLLAAVSLYAARRIPTEP
jgi:membrane-associated phospholipid phosphatase